MYTLLHNCTITVHLHMVETISGKLHLYMLGPTMAHNIANRVDTTLKKITYIIQTIIGKSH
jgi:hypothetical protein